MTEQRMAQAQGILNYVSENEFEELPIRVETYSPGYVEIRTTHDGAKFCRLGPQYLRDALAALQRVRAVLRARMADDLMPPAIAAELLNALNGDARTRDGGA